jgi:hypothetical protein
MLVVMQPLDNSEQIRRFRRLIPERRGPSVSAMAMYLVERYLPGLSSEEVALTARRAASSAAALAADGVRIRYLGSTRLPADEACLCCFEAESAAVVLAANEQAGAPFVRIVEARRISRSTERKDR